MNQRKSNIPWKETLSRIEIFFQQLFYRDHQDHHTSYSFPHRMAFRLIVRLRHAVKHLNFFFRWIILGLIMGLLCGGIGALFRKSLDFAAVYSYAHSWTLYLLPAAGLGIIFMYKIMNNMDDEGTDSILRSARGESVTRFCTAPLIFLSTFLTHLCQGSAGREGAALQLGGSIGSFLGRRFRLNRYEQQMAVMCGMSASFCALLGTPLTAAVFTIEVAGVGTVFYAGLVPSVLASLTAMVTARMFGVQPAAFPAAPVQSQDPAIFVRVILLSTIMALMSIIYCTFIHSSRQIFRKLFQNPFIRIAAGGCLIIFLTLLSGTRIYNGLGMPVILRALNGYAAPQDFLMKLLLTSVTLGAGYKGGEIVPTFFIGASLGCILAPLTGLDPMFSAEIALIGLFCGVVNCPISSVLLSVELFGSGNFILFGLTAAVSYMLSGYYSLYSGQKFMNSKLIPVSFERNAK